MKYKVFCNSIPHTWRIGTGDIPSPVVTIHAARTAIVEAVYNQEGFSSKTGNISMLTIVGVLIKGSVVLEYLLVSAEASAEASVNTT